MLLDTIPTTQGLGFGAYYLFAGMAVIASVWFTLVLPESKVRYNVVECQRPIHHKSFLGQDFGGDELKLWPSSLAARPRLIFS